MATKKSKSVKKNQSDDQLNREIETPAPTYPIVGLGASAGGLEALEEFFGHRPADSGMPFVVVMHQAA